MSEQNVWFPLELPKDIKIAAHRENEYELFRAPGGKLWYRHRGTQESAELRMLERYHHPTLEDLRSARSKETEHD